ncbi:substrate-binding domain-containing protein [Granulicella sp. S156]|jgi:ribose transport system substrate-binding protein|uniref:substrate-binding domain-containing protein n=1 Tax=Granulicella sp. S156 TaxID=1747224 RepID=UPI00131E81CA|nr:substrate-binding domain-containing protein [Granulicella sp. S156]
MKARSKETRPKEKQLPAGKPSETKRAPAQYHVDVLGKGLDVLDSLRGSSVELRLTDIAEKVGLDMSTTFRMLHTLEAHGYVVRDSATKKFRHTLGHRSYRVGYAQLSNEQPFVRKVTQGLVNAAAKAQVELLVVDNKDSTEQALKNAEWLIAQKVDFVIEYEFHSGVGPALADMFRKAGIPLLAIDIPMPSAIYFGVDNYEVGRLGGEALAQFAVDRWKGLVSRVLLLELPEAGPIPQARVLGTVDGIRSVLPNLNEGNVLHKDGKGTEKGGYAITRHIAQSLGRKEHLLIAASNDNCTRGALRAIRELGRERSTAIMSQGWGPDKDLEAELQSTDSPLIGAIAYFPEEYGEKILPIVLQCLKRQPVSPSYYCEHKLILPDRLSTRHSSRGVPANDEVFAAGARVPG